MSLYRYTSSNRIINLSGTVPYLVCLNWLLFGRPYLVEWSVFWRGTLALLPTFGVISILVAAFANQLRKKLPGAEQAIKRGIILVMASFALTLSVITFIFLLFDSIHFLNYQFDIRKYYLAIVATFVITFITAGLYEASYVLVQWRATLIQTEHLKVVNLQSKLDKLKDQVNPHFLFNCLNCLSSLITEDQHKAGIFLNEMSIVYRHLLNNNQASMTTLLDELKFLHSYYHLLKTRYGKGIQMQVDVADGSLEQMLPPLTLQLLVENAIKHNVVLKEKPLLIQIRTNENSELVISNNLQPRLLKAPSDKIGLQNIAIKYQLLNFPGIKINNTKNKFSVTVPLINNPS